MPERTPLQVQVIAHGQGSGRGRARHGAADDRSKTDDVRDGPPRADASTSSTSSRRSASRSSSTRSAATTRSPDRSTRSGWRGRRGSSASGSTTNTRPTPGSKPRTLPDANIAAPEGTRLTLQFAPNMPLLEFELHPREGRHRARSSPAPTATYTTLARAREERLLHYRLKGDERDQLGRRPAPRASRASPTRLRASRSTFRPRTAFFARRTRSSRSAGIAIDDYGVTAVAVRLGPWRRRLPAARCRSSDGRPAHARCPPGR